MGLAAKKFILCEAYDVVSGDLVLSVGKRFKVIGFSYRSGWVTLTGFGRRHVLASRTPVRVLREEK